MGSNRGAALILALLLLSFLAVLGGALLTSTTLDIWIGDNYRSSVQSLNLAEAGIEEGREKLRLSGVPGNLSEPFVSGGKYQVWIRNGVADSLILVSTAEVGNSRRTIEATVRKGAFPENPPAGSLERIVASITTNALDVLDSPALVGNYGSPTDYRVAVVNGDCTLGSGTGYGLLLVRGKLTLSGNFVWTGLILVIGEGVVLHQPAAIGEVLGGFFVARTVDSEPAWDDLTGVHVQYDASAWARANALFPYAVISIREY